jgi:hypothetical protein
MNVSRNADLQSGSKVYFVEIQSFGADFCAAMMPELQKGYTAFFKDNGLDYTDPNVGSIVTIDVPVGSAHSWHWRFLCSRKSLDTPLEILKCAIVDCVGVRKTTLRIDMPGIRLPKPISADVSELSSLENK